VYNTLVGVKQWSEALHCRAGIWGGKGQGKTFQCNLAYKKLDISPIVMSAGELESGNAGEPAKLIRQRYREASELHPASAEFATVLT